MRERPRYKLIATEPASFPFSFLSLMILERAGATALEKFEWLTSTCQLVLTADQSNSWHLL
jgi:hypothetical protein